MQPDLQPRKGPDESDDDLDYRRDRRRDYDLTRQSIQDREHLRVLAILYFVLGGLGAFGGFFPLIYVFMGVAFLNGGMPGGPGGPPPFLGWFFIVFGGAATFLIWAQAVCCLIAGYSLYQTRRYVFCFVVACLCCLSVPLGTVLGVFTIVVLVRPSVKERFTAVASGAGQAIQD